MLKVVPLSTNSEAQAEMLKLIDEVRERVVSGQVVDLAIATVEKEEGQSPQVWCAYWGESQYACLLGSVTALQYELLVSREVNRE